MDVYCPRCGEPWDVYEFHDIAGVTYNQAKDTFFTKGCGFLFNDGVLCKNTGSRQAEVSALMYELMPDDVDGIASMLEDFEYAGMLDD